MALVVGGAAQTLFSLEQDVSICCAESPVTIISDKKKGRLPSSLALAD